jgi:DNA-binding NtrC family response regulator
MESVLRPTARRILLVDDERLVLSSMGRILTRMGYRVRTCASGGDAIDAFGADPGAFDAVVTDSMMREIRGVELARRVSAVRPGVPIVLVTGNRTSVDVQETAEAGIHTVLEKPLTGREIDEVLDRILGAASAP